MKVEIVKETLIDGEIRYSIEIDRVYLSNSVHKDASKVEEIYNRIILMGNTTGTIKEIIKTTDI